MRVAIVANNWIATIVSTADCAKRTANRASVSLLVHERQAWSAMKGLPRTTRPLGAHTALLLLLIFFVAGAQAHWSQHYRYTHNAQSTDFTGTFDGCILPVHFSFLTSQSTLYRHFLQHSFCLDYCGRT